jgi:hypothetical protein
MYLPLLKWAPERQQVRGQDTEFVWPQRQYSGIQKNREIPVF